MAKENSPTTLRAMEVNSSETSPPSVSNQVTDETKKLKNLERVRKMNEAKARKRLERAQTVTVQNAEPKSVPVSVPSVSTNHLTTILSDPVPEPIKRKVVDEQVVRRVKRKIIKTSTEPVAAQGPGFVSRLGSVITTGAGIALTACVPLVVRAIHASFAEPAHLYDTQARETRGSADGRDLYMGQSIFK